MKNWIDDLERAWTWRERTGLINELGMLRVFHGPGESQADARTSALALEKFGEFVWVTEWEQRGQKPFLTTARKKELGEWLATHGVRGAVEILRPLQGTPEFPQVLMGEVSKDRVALHEREALFWIRFHEVRHPGVFLDHLRWRDWLEKRASGLKVLNTFAFTGSLSVAAARGGASEVVTLDLSNPTVEWAQANWDLNQLPREKGRFIVGDVFQELDRMGKRQEKFDVVILDPPSFSRGPSGTFSTSKDLGSLFERALKVLAPRGFILASINSENIALEKMTMDLVAAAKKTKVELQLLDRVDLPQTFPTRISDPRSRYLKGWIARRCDE